MILRNSDDISNSVEAWKRWGRRMMKLSQMALLAFLTCVINSVWAQTSGPIEITIINPNRGSSRAEEVAPSKPGPSAQKDWTDTLPVRPGESLKDKVGMKEKQVVTLFQLEDMRPVDGSVFITGSGYIEVNGGASTFAGMNRALDPYIELTITSPGSPAFQECKRILDKKYLDKSAIAITGNGYFGSRPGVGERQLGVVRLDTVTDCKLVPRR